MAKPWIGIPTRYHDKTETFGQIRHYLDAVIWAGGIPLMIPSVQEPKVVKDYLDRIDGILLPGSPTDIDPAHYHERPHSRLGRAYPQRDALDFALLRHSDAARLPVLGICFGAQSLNVHRGGKLIQDIPAIVPASLVHDSEGCEPNAGRRHLIRIDPNSLVGRLAGKETWDVNTYHHQAVSQVGRDLRVSATAPDGVVEAIEGTTGRFVVGVQWHPERGWASDPFARAIFSAFVAAAGSEQPKPV